MFRTTTAIISFSTERVLVFIRFTQNYEKKNRYLIRFYLNHLIHFMVLSSDSISHFIWKWFFYKTKSSRAEP